jgi:Superfamily I DNA and RNA helicases and helicase subunits
MDYVGKKVFHKAKYGEGTIISQDGSGNITVKFDSLDTEKKFSAPSCFKSFLRLIDQEAASEAEKDNQAREAAERAESERKRQEAVAREFSRTIETPRQSGRSDKNIQLKLFSSTDEFFDEQQRMLIRELMFLRKDGGKKTKLFDGKKIERKGSSYIYSFESDSELNLPDGSPISLWQKGASESVSASVENCEDFVVILSTSTDLGDSVPLIEFSSEAWKLLSVLNDRLADIKKKPSPITRAIICDGYKQVQPGKEITTGQNTACQMSLSQPVTFIWGPPGTGKTETLAKIALAHLDKGYRVLMLSYSNVSVDGAVWRVFNKDTQKQPGRIVRYGYPRDNELLQHDYLSSYRLTLMNHPDLLGERMSLIEERKKLTRFSARYAEIGDRLSKIKKFLQTEEKAAVTHASFVATTVSKAIVDQIIYTGQFDTVIFDEASMAYIPQIVFSASLAKKHFVCMGDFCQLPPIVQSDDTCSLNADIFKYCGIVDAVSSGYGHQWLCMLDTQYRMHPDIAAFSSSRMYHGLLKSGIGMADKRKDVVKHIPFPGDALHLVDLSGMMTVCTKTADQSRINLLSAIFSMGLAINAAQNFEVGIITPYNAQSRLLHAMSRDVAEIAPSFHKITCATVHQFQGSEKDIIIYDAVDCYRMKYPGVLLSSTANNYANRLYNVALTRAKGKMISVVNADYMEAKNLSRSLMFRNLIDSLPADNKISIGEDVIRSAESTLLRSFHTDMGHAPFLKDISQSRKEIIIDIPDGTSESTIWLTQLAQAISEAKSRGVKVFIRTDDKSVIPKEIRSYTIENKYISNPVAVIDRKIVWYGMPSSNADFISEGCKIPTKFRPVFRFAGKYFAQAVYGFLEMNRTVDSFTPTASEKQDTYDSFASYVSGEIKCDECGGIMRLKKSKKGKFYLACSNQPQCEYSRLIEIDDVESYFYFSSNTGILCPQDHTSLQARISKYGLYVSCCGIQKHFYKLDEI